MDFFDEIIECLGRNGAKQPRFTVDPAVWEEWMTSSEPQVRPVQTWPQQESPRQAPMTNRVKIELPPLPQRPSPAPIAPSLPPSPGADCATMDFATLARCVGECRQCPLAKFRKNVVFGEGNPHARLLFIGEGPGANEDATGRPFVGEAGELLTKMIIAMGLAREEVYIANIVKCRPPGNRNPDPQEAESCLPYLKRQIALIQPEAIVTLGAVPLTFLLHKKQGITRLRGNFDAFNGIPVMPTFHPAYLLRNPAAKREVWQDLQQVMRLLGLGKK